MDERRCRARRCLAASRGAALLLCVALAGCAATPRPGTTVARPAPSEDAGVPRGGDVLPGAEREPSGSADAGADRGGSAPSAAPASVALLERSRSERAAGRYAAAASSIERGLRIDPNNALLWLELGEVKLAEDDPQQAEMMARKALTLAGGDRALVARAERLIERAASCGRAGC